MLFTKPCGNKQQKILKIPEPLIEKQENAQDNTEPKEPDTSIDTSPAIRIDTSPPATENQIERNEQLQLHTESGETVGRRNTAQPTNPVEPTDPNEETNPAD